MIRTQTRKGIVQTNKVGSGEKANIKTAKFMAKVAREEARLPLVRSLALKILDYENVDSHNYLEEAKAIGRFVQKHVRYVKDLNGVEQLHSPSDMIHAIRRGDARGDCDDMSLLIATLLLSIGHNPTFRLVRYNERSPSFNHIYVVDYTRDPFNGNKRVVLDAIVKDKPIGHEVKHKSSIEVKI